MVQKNFAIYGDAAVAAHLYVEIGERYIACFSVTENNKLLHSFELFEFSEADAMGFDELLRVVKLHSKLFDQSFVAVAVIWSNNFSVAVPAALYKEETAGDYLLLETGLSIPGPVFKEEAGKQVIAYYVPEEELAAVKHYFPVAKHLHKKSLLYTRHSSIKQQEEIVKIAFYSSQFSLVIYINGVLQLYQKYNYQTTEDVLYYLLNSMQQTGINKENAVVYVGGLLDKNSSLFKELNLYINNLLPDNLSTDKLNKELFAEYPGHYFSPFYNLVV